MTDLAAAFAIVVEALDVVGADHVVVGSTAAAAWGTARVTRDIDIVVVVPAASADQLLAALDREDIYVPFGEARAALAGGGTFNVLHPSTGGKLDVFVALPSDEFTRSRIERRVESEVLGVRTWIASPEDVVLAKLRRRLESRSEVQWRDCVEIAATQPLDVEYLRTWALRLGIEADLDDLLGE